MRLPQCARTVETKTMKIRTYTELSELKTFEERFRYLQLNGVVAEDIFGFDRIVNQRFYRSAEWKAIRDRVIIRDNGCDLGVDGREIFGKAVIHHMNPARLKDFTELSDILLNPEYLITTTHRTHNAIHYGDEGLLLREPIERRMNDTCPWKREKVK